MENNEMEVTREDQEAAQALCASGWTHAIEAFARHRTTALAAKEAENAAVKVRAQASAEMAETYHAAHIEERQRADKAEAENAELRAKVERLREALQDIAWPARLPSDGDPTVLRNHALATLAETQPDERTDNG